MSETPRTDRAANESIVRVYETSKQLERELAASRIVAESNGKLAHDTAIRLACIAAQRDELLEALEYFVDLFWLDVPLGRLDKFKAAIAKAKEEQP